MIEKNMMEVARILNAFAYKNGKDQISTFNNWLQWLCGVFDINKMLKNESGLAGVFASAKNDNEAYFEAMSNWIDIFNEGVMKNGAWDSFGAIYENCFQSKSKADAMGQFFTPSSVSDLMAKIVAANDVVRRDENGIASYYDCACGSGRTLVSAWKECNKYAKNFFMGGDLDISSVNMCALNFMINGMVGAVERRNALSMEWYGGYIVNACKVPLANDMCGLQWYDDEKEFLRAIQTTKSMMKYWNIEQYDPNKTKQVVNEPTEVAEPQPTPQQAEKLQPFTQLTLF